MMNNNQRVKHTSSAKYYSGNQSTSKEKLYSSIPKNLNLNSSNKQRTSKSPSLKISSKTDSQGKI